MGIAAIYKDGITHGDIVLSNIFKVKVQPTSKIISAPVEDGIEVPDMKVRMPKVIVVSCTVVNNEQASEYIEAINKMYESKDLVYYHIHDGIEFHGEDYILQDAPHERNGKEFDFLNYELTFKEVIRISGKQKAKPANSENSDFRNFGFNLPTEDDGIYRISASE